MAIGMQPPVQETQASGEYSKSSCPLVSEKFYRSTDILQAIKITHFLIITVDLENVHVFF